MSETKGIDRALGQLNDFLQTGDAYGAYAQLEELERLAKIGKATELAYSKGYMFTLENDYGDIIDSITFDELVNYVKE